MFSEKCVEPQVLWFLRLPNPNIRVFSVAFGQEFDDDELEAELADLELEGEEEEQAKLDELLINPEPVPSDKLPDVPQDKLAAVAKPKKAEKDDDLADL